MSRQWTVVQIGAREHYAIARALQARGQLHHLYTDIWIRRGRGLLRRLPGGVASLAGRCHADLPADRVTAFNTGSIARIVIAYRNRRIEDSYRDFVAMGQWLSRKVVRRLAGQPLDPAQHAAMLYSTCALETIQHLRSRGVGCVVNQVDPARVEERIVLEECRKWPLWQKQPGRIPDEYYERLSGEWAAADRVLVNSPWSKRALIEQGVPESKLRVVPQAFEAPAMPTKRPGDRKRPLRVLWLGQVILRKGIPYLFEAARQLADENITFTVAGWVGISGAALATAPPNLRVVGPVPREQAQSYYRDADVFVLPTLSDGFAITQLEAMAHGLPVITTRCCGEVVTDGVDGLVIPPADATALADAIRSLQQDRDRLASMSEAAVKTVARFSLTRYGQDLDAVLE